MKYFHVNIATLEDAGEYLSKIFVPNVLPKIKVWVRVFVRKCIYVIKAKDNCCVNNIFIVFKTFTRFIPLLSQSFDK